MTAFTVIEHDAITEPTTIDLDLTQAVERVRVSGSMEAPAGTIGFFDSASAYPIVGSMAGMGLFAGTSSSEMPQPGYGFLGVATGTNGDAAPLWTYEVEYTQVAAVQDPAAMYLWIGAGPHSDMMSLVIVPGVPMDGPQDLAFVEPPVLVTPPLREPYRFGEPLEWELGDRDAASPNLEVIIAVFDDHQRDALMTMFAPAGTTSARVPVPPSDVDPTELLGAFGQVRVHLCELDAERGVCLRSANGQLVEVVP